jgi:hypothetical protein
MTESELSSCLITGMGKRVVDQLTALALEDASILRMCLQFANENNTRAMKASWLLSTYVKQDSSFSEKYQAEVLHAARNTTIGGVRRELLKALVGVNLSEKSLGELIDFSLLLLQDVEQDRAVRYIALKHLLLASKPYPELQQELAQIEVYMRERTGYFP